MTSSTSETAGKYPYTTAALARMPSVESRSSQYRSRGRPSDSTSSSYDGPSPPQTPLTEEQRTFVEQACVVGERDPFDDPGAPERRHRYLDIGGDVCPRQDLDPRRRRPSPRRPSVSP